MNIIGKKYWYLLISLIIIIPGLFSLYRYGLKLSIEFSGGSTINYISTKTLTSEQVKDVINIFEKNKIVVINTESKGNNFIVKSYPVDQQKNVEINNEINKSYKDVKQISYETVGPTIGKETLKNALLGVLVASILIVFYITWSFRKVPKPASSVRFGICAIIALIHDVLVLLGMFSIFGHLFGVEIDSLFVTAVLTVIGFSVHDTIVVFDRIRENLKRVGGENFAEVVNDSILQTLDRSLNTSLTVVLVLVALLIFGGESIRWFVLALLIGIISGTYSSIFNAAPLLVIWQDFIKKRVKR